MSLERFTCKNCGYYFDFDRKCGDDNTPRYCPDCGIKWETKKTPTEIVEEIKRLYHEQYPGGIERTTRESKMEKLLNELKEMAEPKIETKTVCLGDSISALHSY